VKSGSLMLWLACYGNELSHGKPIGRSQAHPSGLHKNRGALGREAAGNGVMFSAATFRAGMNGWTGDPGGRCAGPGLDSRIPSGCQAVLAVGRGPPGHGRAAVLRGRDCSFQLRWVNKMGRRSSSALPLFDGHRRLIRLAPGLHLKPDLTFGFWVKTTRRTGARRE